MSKIKIFGHGVDTTKYEKDPLTQQLREHVFVSSESGRSWGCMGRGLNDEVTGQRILIDGIAEEEWVNEIAGPENMQTAQIVNKVTGVCHQCANRLLIPAGVNVHRAYGNEVAILSFGLYGPDIEEVIKVVVDAAHRVNERNPGTVSDAELAAAMRRMNNYIADEFEVMKNDYEERYPDDDVDRLSADTQSQLRELHARFVANRASIYKAFRSQQIPADAYALKLKENLRHALEELQGVMGAEKYMKMFKFSPEEAVKYIF